LQNSKRRFKKKNSEYKQKYKSDLDKDHAMKWSGVLSLEIGSVLVEVHREITNMRKQGDLFIKKGRNQEEQSYVGRWIK